MTINVKGSCLCKNVKFTVKGPFLLFALCHCTRCQKATGSAHASNIFTGSENIRWTSGESGITRFELPEAERFSKAFCSRCGSPVPCISRDGKRVCIPAGSLDGDPVIRPDRRIYCADGARWYERVELIQSFDGAAT